MYCWVVAAFPDLAGVAGALSLVRRGARLRPFAWAFSWIEDTLGSTNVTVG